jgi:hypothetical protein
MRRGNACSRATHRAARLSIVTTPFALPSGGTNRVSESTTDGDVVRDRQYATLLIDVTSVSSNLLG